MKMWDQQVLHSWLYKQAKLNLGHCPSSSIYTLQTSRVLHGSCLTMCLASARASISADILCQSPQVCWSSKKPWHTTRSFLVCFFLWSPNKWNSTTQCKADQYMHVTREEPFIASPFACLLCRTSFYLCLSQLNIPSPVCLSLSPVPTSEKHSFTWFSQQNTWHNWLSKEPLSFHFRSVSQCNPSLPSLLSDHDISP